MTKKDSDIVIIEKSISSPASRYDFTIEKGAIAKLDYISEPMAEFLKEEYIKNTACLSGSIIALFQLTKVDFEENNKRE
jgi:hypothetical protein